MWHQIHRNLQIRRHLHNQRGALLITLIVAMTVMASFGTAMVFFSSSSTEQELMTNPHNRAYYLAESGLRYATSQRSPSLKDNPALFPSPGVTFSMGSNAQFKLLSYEKPSDDERVIVESTGILNGGTGLYGIVRKITYDISKDNLGEDVFGEVLGSSAPSTSGDDFANLDGWRSNPYFGIQAFTSGTGAHAQYAATQSPPTEPDPDHSGEDIRVTNLILNNASDFSSTWSSNYNLLSYDVQIKMAWGYQLQYGAESLCFRLHESTTANKYQFYAVGFMKYRRLDSSEPGAKDYIPDSIKPSDTSALQDRLLIVLWEQKVESGAETRRWLAYKDVATSSSGDTYVYGNQWTFDGQAMTDNATIMVRVHEKEVGGVRVQDIQVFYGDASNKAEYSSRTPNTVTYDIKNLRNIYWPSYNYTSGSPYPTWPPLDIDSWASTNDYFSFIEESPPSYTVTQTTWNKVVSGIELLSDGGTVRLYDFTSPDGVSSGETTFPTNRYEIGLHVAGEVGVGNTAMTFDDFSLQFLYTDGSTTPGVIQQ